MLTIENIHQLHAIQDYTLAHTKAEPHLLQHLINDTQDNTTGAQMLTGRVEGRLLKLLVHMCAACNIIEVGTFTGYSALSMAEALPNHGKLLTCEINNSAAAIAKKYFQQSPHGHKIQIALGAALATINKTDAMWDFAFIDGDKKNYNNYYEAILAQLKSGGIMVIDNALWGGEVLLPATSHAQAIDYLNKKISQDARVENVLVTIRDGLNIVRKL